MQNVHFRCPSVAQKSRLRKLSFVTSPPPDVHKNLLLSKKRATLNFRKFKVALNPMYRIFLKFAIIDLKLQLLPNDTYLCHEYFIHCRLLPSYTIVLDTPSLATLALKGSVASKHLLFMVCYLSERCQSQSTLGQVIEI